MRRLPMPFAPLALTFLAPVVFAVGSIATGVDDEPEEAEA